MSLSIYVWITLLYAWAIRYCQSNTMSGQHYASLMSDNREGFSIVWSGEKSRDGSECQPIVNIIFVHGLGGHPRETWEAPLEVTHKDGTGSTSTNHGQPSSNSGTERKSSGSVCHDAGSNSFQEKSRSDQTIFWIEDFLPNDVPNARILTYGYNADAIGGLFQADDKNSISQHGRDLAAKLESDLEKEAPIIFVAHSLGGIIAKDALRRSKFASQHTKLMVFLGTPHRGSVSADWGQIASNMARSARQDWKQKIPETLEVNNEFLDSIQEEFKTIVYENNIKVHSFQEARGISGMNGSQDKVLDDFSSRVGLAPVQETVETIDVNHMQMTRYSSSDDSGYRAISSVLQEFIGQRLKTQEEVSTEVPVSSVNAAHSGPVRQNPVAVAWAISFEPIRQMYPLAADLLSLMSVLDRQAIPKSLLSSDKEVMEFEKALGTLEEFSLITPEQSGQSFNLHRLVYQNMRNYLSMNKELDAWTGKALVLLSEHFPEATYENREIWMAFLPHARTVLNSDHLPPSENATQATLLCNVSKALCRKGDYDSAEMMARKSLDLRGKVFGEKNLETLQSLENLGSICWRQGKYEEAEKIHRQALDGFEEMLGKEHFSTVASVASLALVLGGQGKYQEAEILDRRALSAQEKMQGQDHPDTLRSVNNLASVLHRQNRLEEAMILHQRALSAQERILGKEHLDTLTSVNNLASVLHGLNRIEEAVILHQRALSAQERILGKEHPNTLTSVNNLASVLHRQNRLEEAVILHQRALSAQEKVLGKEHPNTLTSVNNLASVLRKQGKYEEAELLYCRALSGQEKIFGTLHPETLSTVTDLARLYHRQGQYETALPLYQKVCAASERVMGPESPAARECAENLASMLDEMGSISKTENREGLTPIREGK